VLKDICYDTKSNSFACNMMRQHTFLSLLLLKLESNPSQVVGDLNNLRGQITNPESITVYMAADVARLSKETDFVKPWLEFLPEDVKCNLTHTNCFAGVKSAHQIIKPYDQCTLRKCVVGIGAVESSFLVECVPCINKYDHEDLPAILVLLQYLTQLEGPMWRQIRGLGLAYGFSMLVNPDEGLLYLRLYECSHVVSAYREARKILENHLSGNEPWKESLLDSARSSLAYEIIERERNIPSLCHQSLLSYFRKVTTDYNKQFLEKVWKVTGSDLLRVGPKYVKKLLTSEESRLVVCCHPSKVDDVVSGFKDLNQNLDVIKNLEDEYLCALNHDN